MAIEDIGPIYPTKIPGLSDNADIQQALRVYHYGASTIPNTVAQITSNSVAGHFKAASDRITQLENQGIGSAFTATLPSSVPNGYIWVNSTSNAPILPPFLVAAYSNDAPTQNLQEGMIWVDKNSSPLAMYVYDTTLGWRLIGGTE